METKIVFRSQICTSKEQSDRLLALGLKKDTADMWRGFLVGGETLVPAEEVDLYNFYVEPIPAWSLDRLRELLPKKIQYDGPLCYREYQLVITDDSVFYVSFEHNDWLLGYGQSLWESMLISIEWLINEELFNKEYLEGRL